MKKFFILFLVLQALVYGNECNRFKGKHYIASFYDCDSDALCDVKQLRNIMVKACEAAGIHLLDQISHEIEGETFSHVLILSNSHATIHTCPEIRACFIDLFTYGINSDERIFDKILTQHLMPGKKKVEVLYRN